MQEAASEVVTLAHVIAAYHAGSCLSSRHFDLSQSFALTSKMVSGRRRLQNDFKLNSSHEEIDVFLTLSFLGSGGLLASGLAGGAAKGKHFQTVTDRPTQHTQTQRPGRRDHGMRGRRRTWPVRCLSANTSVAFIRYLA